jgi:histidinol-phosphate phosphatase family protein
VIAGIDGRPFLTFLFEQLLAVGIRDAVLCTGYMGEQLRQTFGDAYHALGLRYSQEPASLGTAGALRLALPLVRSDTALVMNGDSYCDADLKAYWAWQQRRGQNALLLAEVPDSSRYGCVQTQPDGRVLRFDEKGTASGPGWINAGIYLLKRRALEEIPIGRAVSIEREMFPKWIGGDLSGYRPKDARFLDIGVPDAYEQAPAFFKAIGMRRRFVVLDRDGTIIAEREYLSDPAQVELLPNAARGLRRMRELGLGLIIVTNQSGVGRGYFTLQRVVEVHARMLELLKAEGVELDGIYVCPHTPEDNCACRKPRTRLLADAARELHFAAESSFVIGDKPCDIDLGRNAGATTILVRTGYGRESENDAAASSDYIVDDLEGAADAIAAELKHRNATA